MTLQEQVAWEVECADRGVRKYLETQKELKKSGQGDRTDAMKFLLKQRLKGVSDRIYRLAYHRKGGNSAYNFMLQKLTVNEDYTKLAFMGTQVIFQALADNKPATLLKTTLSIAKRLEADLKCLLFQAEYPGYYHTVAESLKKANVDGYDHKHNVMMKKFKDFDLEWNDWEPAFKIQMGGKIVRCVLEEFHDVLFINKQFTRNKVVSMVEATPEFDKWIGEFEEHKGMMLPELLPLKIPPADWVSQTEGGYHTPALRAVFPFIKCKSKEHLKYVTDNPPVQHFAAANKMQRTRWAINTRVLEVQQAIFDSDLGVGVPSRCTTIVPKFPDHLEGDKLLYTEEMKKDLSEWKGTAKRIYESELKRKGRLVAFMNSLRLAKELSSWDVFHYAANADFRGRMYYATPGLSPQGADHARALLVFRDTVPLGEYGIRWLAVHGASTFGVDKCTQDDQVIWTRKNKELIQAIVSDPIAYVDLWNKADKPYQFLAFCFAWADCSYGTDNTVSCSLPVGVDGTCNGLQHFSAMMRDQRGAEATNLTNLSKPNDIYLDVAKVCQKRLEELSATSGYARIWLRVGSNRKLAKRPVMTLPYGATQQSCRGYILDYCIEHWHLFNLPEAYQWDMARFLTPVLWRSIGDVVTSAREVMQWLRKNTGRTMAMWLSPVDFPVYQYYKTVEQERIETQICGTITVCYNDFNNAGTPALYGQRNGISPNFVHSLDSSHMVMTVNAAETIEAFAMIHDEYGTHAGNVQALAQHTREEFHRLYTEHDPLVDWAVRNNVVKYGMPQKGEYDIDEILNATYFFS